MDWIDEFLAPRQVKIAEFFLFSINDDNEIIPKIKFTPIKAIITNTNKAVENDSMNVL